MGNNKMMLDPNPPGRTSANRLGVVFEKLAKPSYLFVGLCDHSRSRRPCTFCVFHQSLCQCDQFLHANFLFCRFAWWDGLQCGAGTIQK